MQEQHTKNLMFSMEWKSKNAVDYQNNSPMAVVNQKRKQLPKRWTAWHGAPLFLCVLNGEDRWCACVSFLKRSSKLHNS